MFNFDSYSDTLERKIEVQFYQSNGTLRRGDFKATFRRVEQDRIDDMIAENWNNTDVLDEVLVSVSGIGRSASEELPADEQMALARKAPECVAAMVTAFFEAMRPDTGGSKTSRTRR